MSYDQKHWFEGINKINDKYFYIDNKKEVSDNDLIRIKKLGIPPAWLNVWISRNPESPIQAIGTDKKGRKQYRYNQIHINKSQIEKFIRLYKFVKKIPKLDKILKEDNLLPFYQKNKIISIMLEIVRDYHLRVGKEIYVKQNKSFGIASLRKKHVKFINNIIYLKFKGKSNQKLHFTIRNPLYVNAITMLMKLDGDNLFQYISYENEIPHILTISDNDLNKYIKKNMGKEFTIKDFRTYGANLYFIKALISETKKKSPKNRTIIKKNIINAFKSTAKQLRHNGAVSKKSYVMSFAVELYQNNPELFKNNPNKLLIKILKLYIKNII